MNATDQTTIATCVDCSGTFDRPESERWKSRCFACWKRSKATPKSAEPDAYAAGYRAGRLEGLAERMSAYQRGYEAGHASAISICEAGPAPLDRARIRQLLQLAHPDKHNQSPLAGEVTAWLLSLRKDNK